MDKMRPTHKISNKRRYKIGDLDLIAHRNVAIILINNSINKQSSELHPIHIVQFFLKICVKIKTITDIFSRFRFLLQYITHDQH